MKKILVLLFMLFFISPVLAQEKVKIWADDIKPGNGHVTYTRNAYLPGKSDTIHMKTRCDYICSQQTEAVLWGTATYLSSGKIIDYSFMIDKTKLRKYKPITQEDYEIIQDILPYCNN